MAGGKAVPVPGCREERVKGTRAGSVSGTEVTRQLDTDTVSHSASAMGLLIFEPFGPWPKGRLVILHRSAHKVVTRIGRTVAAPDIRIDDDAVSRCHAVIRWGPRQGVPLIRDASSANGTRVNGVRADDWLALGEGSVLRLGETLIVVVPPATPDWEADDLIRGRSLLVHRLVERLEMAASQPRPILLHGPTGTGKELAAEWLHRRWKPPGEFLPVNVAALAESVFEAELFGRERGAYTGADTPRPGWVDRAAKGTLLLDEIGEIPHEKQAALLRLAEYNQFIRVGGDRILHFTGRAVLATNAEVPGAGMRNDLFQRCFSVAMPGLADRREDIPLLLSIFGERHGEWPLAWRPVEPRALEYLLLHRWPGNVRQLLKLVEVAVKRVRPPHRRLTLEDIAEELSAPRDDTPERSPGGAPLAESHRWAAAPGPAVGGLPSTQESNTPGRSGRMSAGAAGSGLRRTPDAKAIEEALRQCGGVVQAAAGPLGVSRRHLYRLIREYGIDLQGIRRSVQAGARRPPRSEHTDTPQTRDASEAAPGADPPDDE